MTTLQEALEAIESALPAYIDFVATREYLAVVHAALAQQGEPVAWMTRYGNVARSDAIKSGIPFDDREDYTIPLYTAAPAPVAQQGEQQPCKVCEHVHAILDADESMIVRDAKDGYPEGRTPRALTLQERVTALCVYAADWKRWYEETQAEPAPVAQRCTYCDGTGDVHGIDGEWRGSCPCAAAPAPVAQQELPQKERPDFMAGYDAGMADAKRMAQQGVQQPVAWYEYNQDLDAWFLAYGYNPKAKTRPLVFGDTAAPAPQPVQEPRFEWTVFNGAGAAVIENITRTSAMEYLSEDRIARGWQAVGCELIDTVEKFRAQSAQPVAQEVDYKTLYEGTLHQLKQVMEAIAQPVAPLTIDDFEEWHKANFTQSLDRRGYTYSHASVRNRWIGWQAAHGKAPAPLTDDAIWFLWASENGLEDCDMCKLDDFKKVFRYVENACGIKGAK